jgi:transcriptional regulator with XRE-family HTH domain
MSGKGTRRKPGGQDPDNVNSEAGAGAGLAELAALARVSSSQRLSGIRETVAPEIRDFAETLRMLFGALGMSLNRLAALLHSDPGTVSRYLSGKRIPPPDFVDSLCRAVYDVKGSLVTPQVQELVHEQFLAALREHNPGRYEVQRLTDLLQAAAQEQRQYQLTVAALEEAIASRNDTIYALELEGRQLRSAWGRTEGLLEEERKQRVHLQETIDSLYAQVGHFKEQLLSAQRRASEAEDRCRELEARLDTAGALLLQPAVEAGAPATDQPGAQLPEAAQRFAREAGADPAVGRPSWRHRSNYIWPLWFQAYLGMEDAAQSIRVYEANLIPGLLQTEEYAAAVISLGDFPLDQAERLVMLRKERQRRFREGKLKLWVLLDEAALRRPVAGVEAQLEQLRYLQEACASLALTLQILPPQAGGRAAPTGFSILRFAERDLPDIVYVEQLTSALYFDELADVDLYRLATERLSIVACEPQNTLDVIDKIIADLTTARDKSPQTRGVRSPLGGDSSPITFTRASGQVRYVTAPSAYGIFIVSIRKSCERACR